MLSEISPEIRGQFRSFLTTLNCETPDVVGAMQAAQEEISYLARRRKLTSWTLQEIARRWQVRAATHRIRFVGPRTEEQGEALADVRPTPSEVRLNRWNGQSSKDANWESNVCLAEFKVVVARTKRQRADRMQMGVTSLATASAHALCRRVERGGGTMMQAMIDLHEALPWIQLAAKVAPDSRFLAPTRHGYWAGEVLGIMDDDFGRATYDGLARTWISSDDTFNPALEEGVARLRTIGPLAAEAGHLIRKLANLRNS